MNTIQKNYAKAKAIYETLDEELAVYMVPHLDLLDTDDGVDEYIDIEMRKMQELKIGDAREALIAAEKALLDWGHEIIKRLPQYKANEADLEKIYSSKLITVRSKMINLTMKLDPTM